MGYWLVKQEPSRYSYADLEQDGRTVWDGVRNFQARNNLEAMQLGDRVLFYHSVEEKAVVGVAKVIRTAFPDPTAEAAEQATWKAVELAPVVRLRRAVGLAELRAGEVTANMTLVRNARLSVSPVSESEFRAILELGNTPLSDLS